MLNYLGPCNTAAAGGVVEAAVVVGVVPVAAVEALVLAEGGVAANSRPSWDDTLLTFG